MGICWCDEHKFLPFPSSFTCLYYYFLLIFKYACDILGQPIDLKYTFTWYGNLCFGCEFICRKVLSPCQYFRWKVSISCEVDENLFPPSHLPHRSFQVWSSAPNKTQLLWHAASRRNWLVTNNEYFLTLCLDSQSCKHKMSLMASLDDVKW